MITMPNLLISPEIKWQNKKGRKKANAEVEPFRLWCKVENQNSTEQVQNHRIFEVEKRMTPWGFPKVCSPVRAA